MKTWKWLLHGNCSWVLVVILLVQCQQDAAQAPTIPSNPPSTSGERLVPRQ